MESSEQARKGISALEGDLETKMETELTNNLKEAQEHQVEWQITFRKLTSIHRPCSVLILYRRKTRKSLHFSKTCRVDTVPIWKCRWKKFVSKIIHLYGTGYKENQFLGFPFEQAVTMMY